jgi:hypothetical protein
LSPQAYDRTSSIPIDELDAAASKARRTAKSLGSSWMSRLGRARLVAASKRVAGASIVVRRVNRRRSKNRCGFGFLAIGWRVRPHIGRHEARAAALARLRDDARRPGIFAARVVQGRSRPCSSRVMFWPRRKRPSHTKATAVAQKKAPAFGGAKSSRRNTGCQASGCSTHIRCTTNGQATATKQSRKA